MRRARARDRRLYVFFQLKIHLYYFLLLFYYYLLLLLFSIYFIFTTFFQFNLLILQNSF